MYYITLDLEWNQAYAQKALAVQKQLSLAQGVFIKDISFFIGTDVHTQNENLAITHGAICILQIHRARAQGFDLRAI